MEGELLGVGVSVGYGEEGEPPGCGAAGGCVLGSEVACFPEHAANVRAVREERVRAVRRLTGLVVYFIRTQYVRHVEVQRVVEFNFYTNIYGIIWLDS